MHDFSFSEIYIANQVAIIFINNWYRIVTIIILDKPIPQEINM